MSTPQPVPPAAPVRRTSITGPVILTIAGGVVLILAVVAGLVAGLVLFRTADSGVLTLKGGVGDSVIAEADAPGATAVRLEEGERYAIHLVTPSDDHSAELEGDVELLTPSGETIVADGDPSVDLQTTLGGRTARSVAAFIAPEDGTYAVSVPAADVDDARVYITPEEEFAPFLAGVLGSALGIVAAVGLGMLGLGMAIGGGIWWAVRARARRAVA